MERTDPAERARLSVEDLPVPVFVVDADGRIRDASPAAGRLLHASPGELRNTPLLRWTPQRARRTWRRRCVRVLERGAFAWTGSLRRADGTETTRRIRGRPHETDHGDERRRLLLFAQPLDSIHRTRPEAVQLLDLLERLPGRFVMVLDREGRIRRASGTGATHRREPSELVATPYEELLVQEAPTDLGPRLDGDVPGRDEHPPRRDGPPDGSDEGGPEPGDRSPALEMWRGLAEDGRWIGVQRHRRPDEAPLVARVVAVPFRGGKGGAPLGTLVSGEDLGPVVEAERARRALVPAAILGEAASRLVRHRPGTDAEEALRGLRRFPRTRFRVREPVRLGGLVEARVEARLAAGATAVRLSVEDGEPILRGAPDELATLVDVLLENADRAVRERGDGEVDVTVEHDSGAVVLRVENPCRPIPERIRERAVEPLVGGWSDRPGLGLAVARAVVEAHGGRLDVEAPAEDRFAVRVELPCREAGAVPESPGRGLPGPDRRWSVLVVDDDEDVRRTLVRYLEALGCEVREAWSGRSAVAALTVDELPDVVVTDLKMEEGSGYWFLRRLEEDWPALVERTVIITGHADGGRASELSERTGCPLLRKPFGLSELVDAVDRADVSGGSPTSPGARPAAATE